MKFLTEGPAAKAYRLSVQLQMNRFFIVSRFNNSPSRFIDHIFPAAKHKVCWLPVLGKFFII